MRKLASPFMMRRRRVGEVLPPETELIPPSFTAVGGITVLQPDGQPRAGNPRVGDKLVVSGWDVAGDPAPQVSIRWQQQEVGTSTWASLWGKGSRFEWEIEEASLGARIRPQLIAESIAGATPWLNVTELGVGPVEPEHDEVADYARTALTAASRSIHSGHSLTDAYTYGHGWPGDLVLLRDSLMVPQDGSGDTYVVRSTIPGSPLFWRWDNGPSANTADARGDIASFETLMITEAGPPHTSVPPTVETLDYLIRFAGNLVLNGAGNELIIWSIWPGLGGPGTDDNNPVPTGVWEGYTFRTGLDAYYKSFKYLADYATWKVKQMHPGLPDDWRAWMIPGDRWMARVYDDIQVGLVPGIAEIGDLFEDDIHPSDEGAYGLSCFAFTALYQIDLRGQAGVYAPDGLPSALRDYFWRIAWELATEYEPVGMGGSAGAALEFDGSVDEDPLEIVAPDPNEAPTILTQASITPAGGEIGTTFTVSFGTATGRPDPTQAYVLTLNGAPQHLDENNQFMPETHGALELTVTWSNGEIPNAVSSATATIGETAVDPDPDPGGDLPAHVIRWTPGDYDGPALTGAQPAVSGGELVFTGGSLSAEIPLSGYYFAARLKVEGRPDQNQPFLLLNVNPSPLIYQKPLARTVLNFWMDPAQLYTQMHDSTEWEEGVGGGNVDVGEYVIVEGWAFGSTVGCSLNGSGDQTLATTDPVPATTWLNLFLPEGDPAGLDIRATGIFLSDQMLVAGERENVRNWLITAVST